jgi:murein DD-endopeptidase MepM/ murein hydrolase activator NlpD
MTEEIMLVALLLAFMGMKRWGKGWAWPVPDLVTELGHLPALVSQEFRRGGPAPHLGVDVMYRGADGVWFAPEGTPVLAARDGVVWSTGQTARGWNVVVDHGAPWATFYQHLAARPIVRAGQRVKAGEHLGVMGADPTDPQGLRHLHFAVWYRGHGDAASVDPGGEMSSWERSRWTP